MGGHTSHLDFDEPLKPTFQVEKPPWVPSSKKKNYTGRTSWWAEAGYSDKSSEDGKLRLVRYRLPEEDPEWYDPPVADGTSLGGLYGTDAKRVPDQLLKHNKIMPLPDFQEWVYRGSTQYQDIAKRWKLSDEHPGLDVSPAMRNIQHIPKSELGGFALVPNWKYIGWNSWGPRFFDKPLDEACLSKGLACAKYTAYIMIPAAALYTSRVSMENMTKFRFGTWFRDYLRLAPAPSFIAFTWGITMCTSARLRHADDFINHFIASTVVTLAVTSLKDNVTKGLITGSVVMVGGILWQYGRVLNVGLTGNRPAEPYTAWPFDYKALLWGDSKVRDDPLQSTYPHRGTFV